MSRQHIQLFLRSFIIIPLPLQPDPDSSWGGSTTSSPDGLVQGRSDSDIFDSHLFLSEFDDGFDRFGGHCVEGKEKGSGG